MSKLKSAIYATLSILIIIAIVICFIIQSDLTLAGIIIAGVLGYIWYIIYVNFSRKTTKE